MYADFMNEVIHKTSFFGSFVEASNNSRFQEAASFL